MPDWSAAPPISTHSSVASDESPRRVAAESLRRTGVQTRAVFNHTAGGLPAHTACGHRLQGQGVLVVQALNPVLQTHWEPRPELEINLIIAPSESRDSDTISKPVG